MLQELFKIVKEFAGDTVINNPDVPNEQNDDVVAEATNTVASGFRNIVAGGGVGSLLNLFKGDQNESNQQSAIGKMMGNPIVAMMVGHFANKLMSKYNIGGGKANGIAASLIPAVISGLISKSSSGQGGFSIANLINSITGGQAEQVSQQKGLDIGSLINQFTGGNNNQQSGGGGLMDIVSQLANGAQQQQARNGGGGLFDLIKGFTRQ